MEVHGKFWGKTIPLFLKNNVEIHRIEGNKGGFSSEHNHESKFNMFVIESGSIKLTVWKDPSGEPDETIIKTGETSTVAPKLYHKFEVMEDCIVYEIYWVELDPKDINRKTSGGIK